MEGRCNQETLVLRSPYNNESHQKLQAEPHVTVSNFKVFDHPHLRHSSGRVWLLKFSSLLPHLSIATEAQNSHIGRSFFLLHEEEANRLQNSWWYPGEALRGRWMPGTLCFFRLSLWWAALWAGLLAFIQLYTVRFSAGRKANIVKEFCGHELSSVLKYIISRDRGPLRSKMAEDRTVSRWALLRRSSKIHQKEDGKLVGQLLIW